MSFQHGNLKIKDTRAFITTAIVLEIVTYSKANSQTLVFFLKTFFPRRQAMGIWVVNTYKEKVCILMLEIKSEYPYYSRERGGGAMFQGSALLLSCPPFYSGLSDIAQVCSRPNQMTDYNVENEV